MRSTGKIAALKAFNGKNIEVNGAERQKITALTTFTGKNSGVNGVQEEN